MSAARSQLVCITNSAMSVFVDHLHIGSSSGQTGNSRSCQFQDLIPLQQIQKCIQLILMPGKLNHHGIVCHIDNLAVENLRHI